VIKSDEEDGGVLEFGTEVIHSKDGTMAALLGASPGASTAVSIMLDIIDKCFIQNGKKLKWKKQIEAMLPLHESDIEPLTIRKQMAKTELELF
jgi:malate dehydrogenase (quinone)